MSVIVQKVVKRKTRMVTFIFHLILNEPENFKVRWPHAYKILRSKRSTGSVRITFSFKTEFGWVTDIMFHNVALIRCLHYVKHRYLKEKHLLVLKIMSLCRYNSNNEITVVCSPKRSHLQNFKKFTPEFYIILPNKIDTTKSAKNFGVTYNIIYKYFSGSRK